MLIKRKTASIEPAWNVSVRKGNEKINSVGNGIPEKASIYKYCFANPWESLMNVIVPINTAWFFFVIKIFITMQK